MTDSRTIWALTLPADALERARARGFAPDALAEAGAEIPAAARPGDKVLLRAAPGGAFAVVLDVGEDGPRVESACPPGDYVKAAPLAPFLPPHDPLAPRVPDAVYEVASLEVERRQKGRRLPPGTPPTEAERRPKIPKKVRRREP